MEFIVAALTLVGGFLIGLGWYRRGLIDMEKEVEALKSRLDTMEKENHCTHTDLEVIKNRIGYMESKIDEIHKVIMLPRGLNTGD